MKRVVSVFVLSIILTGVVYSNGYPVKKHQRTKSQDYYVKLKKKCNVMHKEYKLEQKRNDELQIRVEDLNDALYKNDKELLKLRLENNCETKCEKRIAKKDKDVKKDNYVHLGVGAVCGLVLGVLL